MIPLPGQLSLFAIKLEILERGLLTAAQLDEIFSVENLRKPRYPQLSKLG